MDNDAVQTAARTDDAVLLRELRDGVLTLTLNRPRTLNSLNPALLDALTAATQAAGEDEAVRAIVLTGAGRAFSSGADLTGGLEDSDIRTMLREHYAPAILALHDVDRPVIAALNGPTVGAGASLALACDFRVASERAKLALLFVRIGLAPDAGASFFLPQLVGAQKATELMMLGDDVPADEALRIGLVTSVFAEDEFAAGTAALARRLADAPWSVRAIKRELREATRERLEAQLRLEEDCQHASSQSTDFGEGVLAFVEKRVPRFSGH
jgi:2-(1,2-epoxy-1,2-dihydrophenyl)acetyl-CoA isomerase